MTSDAGEPRPGRMHSEPVRLIGGETGRDFIVPGRSVPEVFAARLMDGSDALEIIWTEGMGRSTVLNRIAKAAELAGDPGGLRRVFGYASDALRDLIRDARLDVGPLASGLGRRLGGARKIEIIPRPDSDPAAWDIVATRSEDLR